MILVGITGTHGAGKGTITRLLVLQYGFTYVSVSEFLAAEAERRGMTPDRQARRMIANEYRAQGETALMEAAFATIDTSSDRAILEPQYTSAEVAFIHQKGGIVIALDADLRQRYERVHVRGSAKDDVSFEEFKQSQEKEMNSANAREQNLVGAMESADIHLTNNGSIEQLEGALKRELEAHKLL